MNEPEQVRVFITTLTDGQGAVKTLDELLTIKKMPREEGFVLETPKAKAVGGKYYLDQALLSCGGRGLLFGGRSHDSPCDIRSTQRSLRRADESSGSTP